ncbi:MAG: hypothetical protein ACK40A_06425 [Pannonibacter indicus]
MTSRPDALAAHSTRCGLPGLLRAGQLIGQLTGQLIGQLIGRLPG